MADWTQLYTYWFQDIQDSPTYLKERTQLWFYKNPQTDAYIQKYFTPLLENPQELEAWKTQSPQSYLALVLLYDQIPRNSFRGTPQSFQYDALALELTLNAIRNGSDTSYRPLERIFLYLPLEHSENLEIQKLSLKKYTELENAAPLELRDQFHGFQDYARRHFEVIEKFGRFPHRNKILNRRSSSAEEDLLKNKDYVF